MRVLWHSVEETAHQEFLIIFGLLGLGARLRLHKLSLAFVFAADGVRCTLRML